MSKTKTKFPECEKLNSVSEESNKIGAFLDWLMNEQNVSLGEFGLIECPECFEAKEELVPLYPNIEHLLAEYFEIDLDKVEKERREILKGIRGE